MKRRRRWPTGAPSGASCTDGNVGGGASIVVGSICDIYALRTRGSRMRFTMSMMKFATIGQTAKNSSSACVSG